MTDEERQALIAAGALEDEIEENLESVDEVAEKLNEHSIVSEERHTEIIEGVSECKERLEALSNRISSENPQLAQILAELATLAADVRNLRSLVDSKLSPPPQSESVIVVTEAPVSPVPAASMEEQRPAEQPATEEPEAPPVATPKRRRRIL